MKNLFGYFIVLSTLASGQAPVSPDINAQPTRQFGHPQLLIPPTQNTPNYVEGREFYLPTAMAFDNSVTPPILYVADSGNNRVLAFKSASAVAGGKADLVIGQQDMQSTLPQGAPNGTFTTGLSSPTGVAVDATGNVYVADAGNNRILRFPAPFSQTSAPVQPDLVIGQKTFSSGNAGNAGAGSVCGSKTLFLASGASAFVAGLAVDSSGNLWASDPLNYRVLMYPAANLTAGTVQPAATTVVGQTSFTACGPPTGSNAVQATLNALVQPSGLAFDSNGGLYVADGYARVLYYTPGIAAQGQPASRVLGIVPQQQPALTYPNQYSLGSAPGVSPPNGVFTMGNNLFVADTGAHRIVEYDVPAKWPVQTTQVPSPPIINVIGQKAVNVGTANQSLPQPSAFTLSAPYGGAFAGTQMWVVDTGNNRILSYTPSGGLYSGASAVVGQLDFIYNAPNLIEGRELYLTASSMVIDNSNPSLPHLYVSDPGNNRILCFKDARKVGQTTPPAAADLVIGQPDLKTSEVNYPNGNALQPSNQGLNLPIGLTVDNNGNLYVADSGNGRVLRFPAPFSQNLPAGQAPTANLVLGQSNFTITIQNATANSMHSPWGLALFAGSDANNTPLAGGLAVSDPAFNRVLIFNKQAGGDFSNGEAASLAIGQASFSTVTSGNGQASFNSPRGIAADTSDRLYVADSLNNRIMIFQQAPENITSGPTASSILTAGLSQPQAVAINSVTTELWVANSGAGVVYRYPEYTLCQTSTCAPTATLSTSPAAPIGLTLDISGNVIVGDSFNHMTLFFPQAFFKNGASYAAYQGMVPGELAILGRLGLQFPIADGAAQTLPWPTTLSDLNLTVTWPGGPAAGTPAPIFATTSTYGAIYFQVPGAAPTSGKSTIVVTQASTGAVLGVGQFQMTKTNPGFFSHDQSGTGLVAALNFPSGTLNSAANPVPRGGTIILCLTGQGQVSGGPAPDGAAPQALMTPVLPQVFINGDVATVGYSGLGFGYPGLWQINVTVPLTGPIPNSLNLVDVIYLSVGSTFGGNTNSGLDFTPGPDIHPITTQIWVGN